MQVDQDEAALDRFRVYLFDYLLANAMDSKPGGPRPGKSR
jgi:hypothetical protein